MCSVFVVRLDLLTPNITEMCTYPNISFSSLFILTPHGHVSTLKVSVSYGNVAISCARGVDVESERPRSSGIDYFLSTAFKIKLHLVKQYVNINIQKQ